MTSQSTIITYNSMTYVYKLYKLKYRFITLPSLAFDALLRMLQKEGQEIELISDEEIYRFVQKALRVSDFFFMMTFFYFFPFPSGRTVSSAIKTPPRRPRIRRTTATYCTSTKG